MILLLGIISYFCREWFNICGLKCFVFFRSFLIILCPFLVENVFCDAPTNSVFITQPQSQTVRLGSTVQLTCQIRVSQVPQLYWSRNGVPLLIDRPFTSSSDPLSGNYTPIIPLMGILLSPFKVHRLHNPQKRCKHIAEQRKKWIFKV